MATKKKGGLLDVISDIKSNRKLKIGRDTIANKDEVIDYVSTGSIILDKLLGKGDTIGGVGRGRMVEIFGLESSGKTTVALTIAREIQKLGGNVCFCDFEAALDIDYASKATGVDVSEDRFVWLRPENLEEGCNIVDHLLERHDDSKIDIVIMDSVKAMLPKVVMDGMMGDEPPMALQARRIGQWLGKVTKKIKDTGTVLILLNQMTKNIKTNPFSSGGEYETPGGLAIRFYASQRIQLKQVTKETKKMLNPITHEEDEMPVSVVTRASIIKNKIGTPYRKATFHIKYGGGIDNMRSIVDMAVSHGVITRGGAWYSYKPDEGGFKIQGDEAMRNFLFSEENRGLLKEIAGKITFQQDKEVKKEAMAFEKEAEKLSRSINRSSKKNNKDKKSE